MAGEEFGGFQSSRRRFLTGLFKGELSESVGLGSQRETVGTDFSRNGGSGRYGDQREDEEGRQDGEPFHSEWDGKARGDGSQAAASEDWAASSEAWALRFHEEFSAAQQCCVPYLSHDRGVPGGNIRAALVMSQFASRNPPTLSSDRIREGIFVP